MMQRTMWLTPVGLDVRPDFSTISSGVPATESFSASSGVMCVDRAL